MGLWVSHSNLTIGGEMGLILADYRGLIQASALITATVLDALSVLEDNNTAPKYRL